MMNMLEENERARNLALKRISIREYSASEMRAYLSRKGFPEELVSEIVSDLVREGVIDDRRYAKAVSRSQTVRDKGPLYIRAKLRQKGVNLSSSESKAIFAETSDKSEQELALSVLEKRYSAAAEDERVYRRAFQGLLRRGFSPDIAQQSLKEFTAGRRRRP